MLGMNAQVVKWSSGAVCDKHNNCSKYEPSCNLNLRFSLIPSDA